MVILSAYSNSFYQSVPQPKPVLMDLEERISRIFSVQVTKLGSIQMKPSKDIGEKKSCIYAIWNAATKMTYIGKTDQMFKKRLSQHVYCANHPAAEAGKSRFYQSLRENPVNFRFGLINLDHSTVADPDDLAKKEIEEIKKIPLELRLNSNIGGGGGTSPTLVKTKAFFDQSKTEIFKTPKKYYPLKVKSKKIAFELTPGIAQAKNAIYVIKNLVNGKRYIGFTSQSVKNRLGQHAGKANRKRGLFTKQTIHQEMQANPMHFQTGLLARDVSIDNLPALEKKMIDKKRAYADGYNRNQGGGGSIATKKIKV
jgi:hypothetical protein